VRRTKVALVTATAVALALSGCSPSGGNNEANPTSTIGTQTSALDPTAKGPAAEVPGAKKGGTLTVYSQSTPNSFDPTDIYYVDSNEIGKLIFRTPTQFALRNGKPVLVPDLTDLGKVSDDKLTWTFKLQSGMKYADGTAVKVEDLAYAIKRSFAHDVFENGPTYQVQFFKDGDKYKGPYTGGDTYSGVETQGTDTLIIHLAKPFSDLPFYMTFPMFTPIPQAKDTREAYRNMPLATGPYQFDTFTPGTELKLKKNTNWDPNTDPVRHQYVDAWDFKWGVDDVQNQQQILNGTGPDAAAVNYGNFDSSLIPQLTGDKKSLLITGDSPCTIVWNIDTRKITDVNVRKAIAVAYPQDAYFKTAGLNDYTAEPASTVMPPSVPGYTKYTPLEGLSGKGAGDPAAAKKLLETAGKVGFELSWYYDNTKPIPQQITQLRKDALTAAGFTVNPIGVPTATLRSKTGDYDAPVNLGQSPGGWCSDWPSGGSWFPVLFQTHSIDDGQSWGFMADKTLDQQIDDIANLPADQATAKWGDLDKKILGMYVAIPLYYNKLANIRGTAVGGAEGDGTMGMPFFVNMFVKS